MFTVTLLLYITILLLLSSRLIKNLKQWCILRHIPGPSHLISLPIIGHTYLLHRLFLSTLRKFRQKYGNVYRFDVGAYPTVIVNSYNLISEAARKEAFSGRTFSVQKTFDYIQGKDSRGNFKGIAGSVGPVWKAQRKYAMVSLHKLGGGNDAASEALIAEVAKKLSQDLKAYCGNERFETEHFFMAYANQIVWRFLTGDSHEKCKDDVERLLKASKTFFSSGNPASISGLLQYNSHILCNLMKLLRFSNIITACLEIKNSINEKVRTSTPDEHGCYIETFLAKIASVQRLEDDPFFYGKDGYDQIVAHGLDFFLAGTDTSALFLEWCFYYMAGYPKIQNKVHQEIMDNIGYRDPLLSDKENLPLTMATIEEISRMCNMSANGVPHMTLVDTKLDNILIPKNTQVIFNFETINRDGEIFPEPDKFHPDRYIQISPNGSKKFKRQEEVALFGFGKRRCIGEALARAEQFLFFTKIFQEFQVILNDSELPQGYFGGLTLAPPKFNVKLVLRY